MAYADHPHKPGPPFRADGPTRIISLRLTRDELDALELQCDAKKTTRAELIRAAMEHAGLFSVLVDEQQPV